ncbi:MgtC/SapB family protein [Pseudogracilibacillus sp. SO30301A]|uniref:MgtC/SapB family protein n=1 Tax=Pseudogracilibacillus sp. SO30301A TaxID=3098291 RepID=UPI00300E2310
MSVELIKLLVAAVAGLILGIERESKHKPLGLKTCIVISVTSCLLTIISIETAMIKYDNPFIRSDPMRLSAQIVSGVGFLGAGVILRRNNDVISGLTTAAIVWTASGIGIATGAGYFREVTIGIIILVFSIRLLPYIVTKIGPSSLREQEINLTVFVEDNESSTDFIFNEISKIVGDVKNVKISSRDDYVKVEMRCTLDSREGGIMKYYHRMKAIEGIKGIEVQGR